MVSYDKLESRGARLSVEKQTTYKKLLAWPVRALVNLLLVTGEVNGLDTAELLSWSNSSGNSWSGGGLSGSDKGTLCYWSSELAGQLLACSSGKGSCCHCDVC
jgi:hypothetical protein